VVSWAVIVLGNLGVPSVVYEALVVTDVKQTPGSLRIEGRPSASRFPDLAIRVRVPGYRCVGAKLMGQPFQGRRTCRSISSISHFVRFTFGYRVERVCVEREV
jgi:hypothetical protein